MKIRSSIACGAIVGLCIGACLGGGLLLLGEDRFGTEAMEGAAMFGILVSLPLSAVLDICFDWGGTRTSGCFFWPLSRLQTGLCSARQ